jgi:hypothetical protein
MVFVPDTDEADDPPNRRKPADTGQNTDFEEKLGATVVRHLRETSRVEVRFTGDNVKVEPLKRESERQRTGGEPSTTPQRGIEQTERNRQTASN